MLGGGGVGGGGGGSGSTMCSAVWRADKTITTMEAWAQAVRMESNQPRRERVRRNAWTLETTMTASASSGVRAAGGKRPAIRTSAYA